MLVTARDDGILRTHDDVREMLRYAIPGASFTLHPVGIPGTAKANASSRRYEITVPRLGGRPVAAADVYSLPLPALSLARRARELADYALRA